MEPTKDLVGLARRGAVRRNQLAQRKAHKQRVREAMRELIFKRKKKDSPLRQACRLLSKLPKPGKVRLVLGTMRKRARRILRAAGGVVGP